MNQSLPHHQSHLSLYNPAQEHDACGVGMVAQIDGRRSNKILKIALRSLCGLMHRGALDADACTGDGAGITTQIPYKIFRKEVEKLGHQLYRDTDLGIGMMFLPHQNLYAQARAKAITEEVIAKRGLFLFGWRSVPVNPHILGAKSISTMPTIEQVLVGRPEGMGDDDYERRLFLARNEIEDRAAADKIDHFYIPSFSHRMLIYKGLLVSASLEKFFPDLCDPDFETALCVYHQRYSTNTFPTWPLAHPFRMLAHNGEINTVRGNRNWTHAREAELKADFWGPDIDLLKPIIQPGASDSSSLDNVLEVLTMSGRSLLHAMTLLVPPSWDASQKLSPQLAGFYEYHTCLCEPWDGPAALVFTDGVTVGACLDRNGLRPARYEITQDGLFVIGSEIGVSNLDQSTIIEKGRLGPGEMIAIDTAQGKLLRDTEIKNSLAQQKDYHQFVDKYLVKIKPLTAEELTPPLEKLDDLTLTQQQICFGYTKEELEMIFKPMINDGAEAVGSMGDDTPLAVLSLRPRLLYTYFSQLFAQVTNPPIDPIRERLVMSLLTALGWKRNLLSETPEHAEQIIIDSPILFNEELAQLKNIGGVHQAATLSTLWSACDQSQDQDKHSINPSVEYAPTNHQNSSNCDSNSSSRLPSPISHLPSPTAAAAPTAYSLQSTASLRPIGRRALAPAVRELCKQAEKAVDQGARLLILSDRGISKDLLPIPALLAMGAVHHHLTRVGKRMKASLISETGEARDVHQLACLIGYGASAINPYLALETIRELLEQDHEKKIIKVDFATALLNYKKALSNGLLKIMSKMGISVIGSYRGAQTFEAIGLCSSLIKGCFSETSSQIEGIGFEEIAEESLARHQLAYHPPEDAPVEAGKLSDPGYYRFRRAGELHAVTPPVIKNFHTFIRTQKPEDYKAYVDAVLTSTPHSLRNLLTLVPKSSGPVPLEEVESIEEIRRRFTTAGMSLGALSPEAHETLAIAMNRIGGKSNSGEGGEDFSRTKRRENGDWANSAIKQIASGRFGVSAAYLASAKEIEIKMAQGAKPGEGGQLPGQKINFYIAKLRHSVPGVTLISPPPHHDIYSIEDLAQLIYDLKQVNPRARICVKLVAEAGIGTIAAGVAKAHADIILISGHEGGTGAAPLSSLKHAGGPWELGLTEAHQVLLLNQLRNRVTLRTDGGMRTGEDIVYATLLGAEEYNFGTAALIAMGCVYVRQCHLNNCPVGVATLDERLRAKFKGKPENVVNFFNAVAEEVRHIMARLGFRTIDEMIGRTQYLRQKNIEGHPKANKVDLSRMIYDVVAKDPTAIRYATRDRNDSAQDQPLDDIILQDAEEAIRDGTPITLSYKVDNTNRAVGTKVAGEIAYRYGEEGLPEGTITLNLHGTAGQSLGAFLTSGVRIILSGEANDYVGKSMSGGEIIIRPRTGSLFSAKDNSIIGNTVMYGAIQGKLFANGRAGERFCVRNSGATAVIEGIGDHGCEYMTGGTVVVLGPTGKNFGAGMTGGTAYVLDATDHFLSQYNPQLVTALRLTSEENTSHLQELIKTHHLKTGSQFAQEILSNWPLYQTYFWKITPHIPLAKPVELEIKKEDEQTSTIITEAITVTPAGNC
ncbi:MAG TPA: glutamate synthase large subunit [Chthoniobacterales bacterium]|nr:glutamate synthase large subunit [Chthoniobacterales bacterium]